MIRVLVKGQPVPFTIDRSGPQDRVAIADGVEYAPEDVTIERFSDDPKYKAGAQRPTLRLKRTAIVLGIHQAIHAGGT